MKRERPFFEGDLPEVKQQRTGQLGMPRRAPGLSLLGEDHCSLAHTNLARLVVDEPTRVQEPMRGAVQPRPIRHSAERTCRVTVVEKGVTERAQLGASVKYQY